MEHFSLSLSKQAHLYRFTVLTQILTDFSVILTFYLEDLSQTYATKSDLWFDRIVRYL